MQRAKIRSYALVILVILAAASMLPSFGGSDSPHPHRANPQPHNPQAVAAKARPQIRASFRNNK
jgi:hypothetical protein